MEPEPGHLHAERAQRPGVGRDGVVREVAANDAREPRSLLSDGQVHRAGAVASRMLAGRTRTTDEHSVFDPVTATWIAKGARHRELARAFFDDGDRRLFPFSATATLVHIRPELQLRLRPSPRREPL